jgi:hypothetical protein
MLKFKDIMEQDDQDQPVDQSVLANELHEKIRKTFYGFTGRIKYFMEDGTKGYMDVFVKDNPEVKDLGIGVTYYPDLQNPVIPQNYLVKPVSVFINHLKENVFKEREYPKEVLEQFKVKIDSEAIYYSEGILRVLENEVLPAAERNVIKSSHTLYEFIYDTDQVLQTYVIQNPPKFSSDYVLAMDKAVKKMKTIYKALRKGTFKGRSYELREDMPTMVVHQRFKQYNKEDRVIYPEFSSTITSTYPKVDGKEISHLTKDENDVQYLKELDDYLTKKFENFGITYR